MSFMHYAYHSVRPSTICLNNFANRICVTFFSLTNAAGRAITSHTHTFAAFAYWRQPLAAVRASALTCTAHTGTGQGRHKLIQVNKIYLMFFVVKIICMHIILRLFRKKKDVMSLIIILIAANINIKKDSAADGRERKVRAEGKNDNGLELGAKRCNLRTGARSRSAFAGRRASWPGN